MEWFDGGDEKRIVVEPAHSGFTGAYEILVAYGLTRDLRSDPGIALPVDGIDSFKGAYEDFIFRIGIHLDRVDIMGHVEAGIDNMPGPICLWKMRE